MNSGDHRGQIVMRERRATVTIERAGRTPTVDLQRAGDRVFLQVLVNTLLVSVINFTVWFAITFYVYLETRSVFATGMVAGIFLVVTAVTGIWFGSLVDHHPKKTVMQVSAAASLAAVRGQLRDLPADPATSFPTRQRHLVGVRGAGDARRHRRQRPHHRAASRWSRC